MLSIVRNSYQTDSNYMSRASNMASERIKETSIVDNGKRYDVTLSADEDGKWFVVVEPRSGSAEEVCSKSLSDEVLKEDTGTVDTHHNPHVTPVAATINNEEDVKTAANLDFSLASSKESDHDTSQSTDQQSEVTENRRSKKQEPVKTSLLGGPCGIRGKEAVSAPRRKAIFHVRVTCSGCQNQAIVRTRTGAPYTDHFLDHGFLIECLRCGHLCKASCQRLEDSETPDKRKPDAILIRCSEDGCNSSFQKLGLYGQHKLRHTNDPVVCHICKKTYENPRKLSAHQAIVHRDTSRDVICELCAKPFKNSNELRRHQSSVHTIKPTIKCNICSKVVRSEYGLRVHMSSHKQKAYACPVCKKVFESRAGRNSHHKSHLGNNKCEICNKEFSTIDGFLKHQKLHDRDRETFECPMCAKHFKSKLGFSNHLNCHLKLEATKQTAEIVNSSGETETNCQEPLQGIAIPSSNLSDAVLNHAEIESVITLSDIAGQSTAVETLSDTDQIILTLPNSVDACTYTIITTRSPENSISTLPDMWTS